jgi:ubiquinone/menaquinone biosynthesis C-methylase UbiE
MQTLPFPDGHFDFVWCRDVVTQVDDLEAALRETARVLSADGHMLVYATLRTDRMSTEEGELFSRHLGNVPANLEERNVENAFANAG